MERKKGTSGFASMNPDKQREIARKGGMAAHRKGTAHEFSADEARNAGRKGGNSVSANRSHMVEIGRRGGIRSAVSRRKMRLERLGGGGTGSSQPRKAGGESAVNFIQTSAMEQSSAPQTVIQPTDDTGSQLGGHQAL